MNPRVALVHSDGYAIRLDGLEKSHPFDSNKYGRIFRRLVEDGLADPKRVHSPGSVSDADLLRVHTPRYVRALRRGSGVSEALEFPELGQIHADRLLSAVVMPHLLACGGTVLAARLSASHPVAVNLGGGYHHAMPDRGEGFCLVADIAVAVRAVQADCSVGRTLVIDLDVHQGNGTALIFADDETVFTFSMHQADIYPIPKEFSDWDVELESGMKDIQYLALLEKNLPEVFNLARPDVVFFQAGCDVLAGDPLAGLALTEGGVVRRDWMVVEHCLRRNVPVVMTLGGGYARDSWRVQAESIKNLLQKC